MKKKYKVLISILLAIILFFGAFNLRPKADSGWDSSYDGGGGSWDSGSSWDSDSSWSSWDSNSSSSSYHGSSTFNPLDFFFLLFVIIIIIIIISSRSSSGSVNSLNSNMYNDLDDEILAKYGINKEAFKQMVYDKYVEVQEAWMNFDYDKLRLDLTDELYNTYMMQLDALKLKNQKNIMSDFNNISVKITNINEENGLLNVVVYLNVQMYDYVVDSNDTVVRGNKSRKINIEYLITFVKTASDSDKETTCPNCGAKIDAVANGKCDYCGTVVVVDAKDFVISKKTCIGQR